MTESCYCRTAQLLKSLMLLLIVVMFSVSCSSKKLVSSWGEEGCRADEVLVVGVAHLESLRKLFEEAAVDSLIGEDKTAIASFGIDGVRGRVSYESIQEAVRLTDAKTVLIMRKVDAVEEIDTQDAVGRTYEIMDHSSFEPILMPQPAYSTNSRMKYGLEATLYKVDGKKKIWTARASLINPVSSKKYISEAVEVFVKDMKRRGII